MDSAKTDAKVKAAADLFWESIPPFWYSLRAHIHSTAREKYEITGGHFHVLRRIKRGDSSVSELAEAGHISRPVVSRKVDSLVEKGLVSRRELPEDRRYTVLELTDEGVKVLQEISISSRVWLEERLGTLDYEDLEKIIQAFTALRKLSG